MKLQYQAGFLNPETGEAINDEFRDTVREAIKDGMDALKLKAKSFTVADTDFKPIVTISRITRRGVTTYPEEWH